MCWILPLLFVILRLRGWATETIHSCLSNRNVGISQPQETNPGMLRCYMSTAERKLQNTRCICQLHWFPGRNQTEAVSSTVSIGLQPFLQNYSTCNQPMQNIIRGLERSSLFSLAQLHRWRLRGGSPNFQSALRFTKHACSAEQRCAGSGASMAHKAGKLFKPSGLNKSSRSLPCRML